MFFLIHFSQTKSQLIVFRARLFQCISFHTYLYLPIYIYLQSTHTNVRMFVAAIATAVVVVVMIVVASCLYGCSKSAFSIISSTLWLKQNWATLHSTFRTKRNVRKKSKKKQKQKHFSFAHSLWVVISCVSFSVCCTVKYQYIYIYKFMFMCVYICDTGWIRGGLIVFVAYTLDFECKAKRILFFNRP